MKLVIIESPFAADTDEGFVANEHYAQNCAKYGLLKFNESGWGSHMIWPQFLDDTRSDERELGIQAGLAWSRMADYHVFYTDRGWSKGMIAALRYCIEHQRPFRFRSLNGHLRIQFPPEEEFPEWHVRKYISLVTELYS